MGNIKERLEKEKKEQEQATIEEERLHSIRQKYSKKRELIGQKYGERRKERLIKIEEERAEREKIERTKHLIHTQEEIEKLKKVNLEVARLEKEERIISENIIHQYKDILKRKRLQKIIKDDYGNIDDTKWKEEKSYFFHNVMKKNDSRVLKYHFTMDLIDEILDEYEEEVASEYSENMTPYDYEHYCASILNKNGWQAQATQGSGDQGVDVVATKNGHKIAIQCKKYSSPVGNKAVQEVFSARSHVGADHAIVVTNHTYTKSAKELASTTGVLLLHHDELKKLPF